MCFAPGLVKNTLGPSGIRTRDLPMIKSSKDWVSSGVLNPLFNGSGFKLSSSWVAQLVGALVCNPVGWCRVRVRIRSRSYNRNIKKFGLVLTVIYLHIYIYIYMMKYIYIWWKTKNIFILISITNLTSRNAKSIWNNFETPGTPIFLL